MLLNPEVLTILILDFLFLFFTLIAFYYSVKIFLRWDIKANTQEQYTLQKQSYLSATIIKYIFFIKVPLFLFFIFTLDKISNILTGAMCGAGVVDATDYGNYLLVLKVLNLYIFAYWIALHNEDMKHEDQPYTRVKFGFFIVAFLLFLVEIALEGMMFTTIDLEELVDCCGTIYSTSSTSYIGQILNIDHIYILGVFYINLSIILFAYIFKKDYIYSMANFIFIIVSLISLISFFGTYIYEMPTHHCAFCYLQRDYNYVGYLIYTLLFIGTFYGLLVGFMKSSNDVLKRNYNISLLFDMVFSLLVTYYPVSYFIRNGVFL